MFHLEGRYNITLFVEEIVKKKTYMLQYKLLHRLGFEPSELYTSLYFLLNHESRSEAQAEFQYEVKRVK